MKEYSISTSKASFRAASGIGKNQSVDNSVIFDLNLKDLWDKCPNGSMITFSLSGTAKRSHAQSGIYWSANPRQTIQLKNIYIDTSGNTYLYKTTNAYTSGNVTEDGTYFETELITIEVGSLAAPQSGNVGVNLRVISSNDSGKTWNVDISSLTLNCRYGIRNPCLLFDERENKIAADYLYLNYLDNEIHFEQKNSISNSFEDYGTETKIDYTANEIKYRMTVNKKLSMKEWRTFQPRGSTVAVQSTNSYQNGRPLISEYPKWLPDYDNSGKDVVINAWGFDLIVNGVYFIDNLTGEYIDGVTSTYDDWKNRIIFQGDSTNNYISNININVFDPTGNSFPSATFPEAASQIYNGIAKIILRVSANPSHSGYSFLGYKKVCYPANTTIPMTVQVDSNDIFLQPETNATNTGISDTSLTINKYTDNNIICFYAIYAKYHSITFNNNLQDQTKTNTNCVIEGNNWSYTTTNLPTLTANNGYNHIGWTTSTSSIGYDVSADDGLNTTSGTISNVQSDIILYSVWKKKYRIRFYDGSSLITSVSNKYYDLDVPFPTTNPTKNTHQFMGWTRDSSKTNWSSTNMGDSYYDINSETVPKIQDWSSNQDSNGYFNIDYYAVWLERDSITIEQVLPNSQVTDPATITVTGAVASNNNTYYFDPNSNINFSIAIKQENEIYFIDSVTANTTTNLITNGNLAADRKTYTSGQITTGTNATAITITITYIEGLPIFYPSGENDFKRAMYVYWEGNRAIGLYYENTRLL